MEYRSVLYAIGDTVLYRLHLEKRVGVIIDFSKPIENGWNYALIEHERRILWFRIKMRNWIWHEDVIGQVKAVGADARAKKRETDIHILEKIYNLDPPASE